MDVRFLNLEYFFNQIVEFFRSIFNPHSSVGFAGGQFIGFIQVMFKVMIPIGIVLLFVAWIYYQIRFIELRKFEHDRNSERLLKKQQQTYTSKSNERWEQIEGLFQSASPGDWRLAIIEADSMLEDLVVQLGYSGESLGERLKNVNNGDFPDLQAAWEVHLVRNKIAHEGLAYHLAERDKRHIHNLYQKIFTNAGII
jgi:hypothetical protein